MYIVQCTYLHIYIEKYIIHPNLTEYRCLFVLNEHLTNSSVTCTYISKINLTFNYIFIFNAIINNAKY